MTEQLRAEVFKNRLKLKHLFLLAALKQHTSLHSAAAALNVSQPAATRLLQEIEELVGGPLFSRSSKGLRVTDLGQLLVNQAALLSVELDDIFGEVRNISDGVAGTLNIGVISAAPPFLLPRTLANLRGEAPDLKIRVREGTQESLLEALREGDLDMVIGRAIKEDKVQNLHFEVVYYENFSVVSRFDHPLTKLGRPVTLADTVDWPWILPLHSTFLRHNLEVQFLLACKRTPTDYLESVAVLTNVGLLQETDSVTVLPRSVANNFCKGGLLTSLIDTIADLTGPVLIVRRFETVRRPQQQRFLDAMSLAAASLGNGESELKTRVNTY